MFLYKIKNDGIRSYLAELIPSESHLYNTQNARNITTYSCRADAFKYILFTHGRLINGINLTLISKHPVLISLELANLIKIIQPIPNSVFGIVNPLD